jgi:subtilisin family serine protease
MVISTALLVASSLAVVAAYPPHGQLLGQEALWVHLAPRTPLREAFPSTVSERALGRRALRGRIAGLAETDRPLEPAFVAAIRATGARIRVESRWLNAISVEASPAQRSAIAALPFVRSIAPVARGARRPLEESPSFAGDDSDYGAALAQVGQIDLLALHARGFRGEGMVIGILDTGFRLVHEAFNNPAAPIEVIAQWDFINDDGNTDIEEGDHPNQHRHGTWILGTLAANLPGLLVGVAPDASYILAKTEDVASETPIEEDFYVAGLEWIEALGADVATSSLGYIDWYLPSDLDGATAVTTIAVNIATAKGLVCVTAAGNGGHDADPTTLRILAPADALEVISCGAVRSDGTTAAFSSDGPSADGRVKPELLARGVATATVHSTNTTGISAVNGTSLSTPLVAGAVACILQARPELGVAALRELLFATASESKQGPDPLFIRGYGILQSDAAARTGRLGADINLDGTVGAADLAILIEAWGACSTCTACPADLDGDCTVGPTDLAVLLGQWNAAR